MAAVIRIKGGGRLQLKFNRLGRKIKNRRGLMNRIGIQLLNEIDKSFREEGREGTPWAPLQPATIERRRRRSEVRAAAGRALGSTKILQDRGTLRESFGMDFNNQRVKVGTPTLYAPTHQEGRGNIPARPMLPTKKRALNISIDVARKYIKRSIKGSGLK